MPIPSALIHAARQPHLKAKHGDQTIIIPLRVVRSMRLKGKQFFPRVKGPL